MFADKKDGQPWSPQDLADLKDSIDAGSSLAATATFLSRAGSLEDVLHTAEAHGWKFRELHGPPRQGDASSSA